MLLPGCPARLISWEIVLYVGVWIYIFGKYIYILEDAFTFWCLNLGPGCLNLYFGCLNLYFECLNLYRCILGVWTYTLGVWTYTFGCLKLYRCTLGVWTYTLGVWTYTSGCLNLYFWVSEIILWCHPRLVGFTRPPGQALRGPTRPYGFYPATRLALPGYLPG